MFPVDNGHKICTDSGYTKRQLGPSFEKDLRAVRRLRSEKSLLLSRHADSLRTLR